MVFEDAQASALASITAKGKAYKLRTYTEGTPADPLKPWEPGSPAVVEYDVVGVTTTWTRMELGTGIPRSDIKMLVPASGLAVDITTKMHIVDESEVDERPFDIKSVVPLNPNGEKIMFTLQLRR